MLSSKADIYNFSTKSPNCVKENRNERLIALKNLVKLNFFNIIIKEN